MAHTQCQSSNSWELKFENIDTSVAFPCLPCVFGTVECILLKWSVWLFPCTYPLLFTTFCVANHPLTYLFLDSSSSIWHSWEISCPLLVPLCSQWFLSVFHQLRLISWALNLPIKSLSSTCSLDVPGVLKSTWLAGAHDVPPPPGSPSVPSTWVSGAAPHPTTHPIPDSRLSLHLYSWANPTDLSY